MRSSRLRALCNVAFPAFMAVATALPAAAKLGYFRMPTVAGDTVVFVAEGDLWRVPITGGRAERLTTHPAEESTPALSPDGKTLAFIGRYEGTAEAYVMPLAGGAPKRITYAGAANMRIAGWSPEGHVWVATNRYSPLATVQIYKVDPATLTQTQLPLAEAAEACSTGNALVFARQPVPSDNVKRYQGGHAQSLWRYVEGNEAAPLTADHKGTSRQPMCWQGRIYFLSDRDGTMNLWSMTTEGRDATQHTRHNGWDIRGASLSAGKVVYQLGAKLRVFDVVKASDSVLDISLPSDFDHTRTRWIKSPVEAVSDVSISPTGDRVALVARGQLFVAPAGAGRRVEVTRAAALRARGVQWSADGKSLYTFSDNTGEMELWRYPANGAETGRALTKDAKVLRQGVVPSPDGKWAVHWDKDRRLSLLNIETGEDRLIDLSAHFNYQSVTWASDSRALAFVKSAANQFDQVWLYTFASGKSVALTSDRYHARSPAFSPDGKVLYFLSDRNLQTLVPGPWGQRNPRAFFDRQTKIYGLMLDKDARWPFTARNELTDAKADAPKANATKADAPKTDAAKAEPPKDTPKGDTPKAEPAKADAKPNKLDLDGLAARLYEVPAPAGNYELLSTDGKRLYYIVAETTIERKRHVISFAIEAANPQPPQPEVFFTDVRGYQLSADRKKILLRRANDFFVVDAGAKAPPDLSKAGVDLRDWSFEVDPREEWRQMFTDAWRMHRDFLWDKNMRGVDWPAMRKKYEPLLAHVTDRAELSDVLAQMVSELSTLHSQVGANDVRRGADDISVATLGAEFERTEKGYRVTTLFMGDPELPDQRSPLALPHIAVRVGDTLVAVNGQSLTAGSRPLAERLRNKAGRQTLLSVVTAEGATRSVVVTPITARADGGLRYAHWEHDNRRKVDGASQSRIGYLHLQSMVATDMAHFAREFYPVFQREGLILDLRDNGGGNIDSWIIETLQRRAWMFWQARNADAPYPNQQLAFRGHVVALIDGRTYSDGETLSEGLKRNKLATLIGMRTAGAGIWLSDGNRLKDGGIARAAESGQFAETNGTSVWLVEGTGVTPDIVVDNLPHAAYKGRDAQLEAAIEFLKKKMASEPMRTPKLPAF